MTDMAETAEKMAAAQKAGALSRAETMEAEAAKIRAEAGLEPLLIFPDFQSAPGGFQIDEKTKTFWVGFSFLRMDYNGAKDFLDGAKFQIWNLYIELQKQAQARAALAARPAPTGIKGLLSKLGGR